MLRSPKKSSLSFLVYAGNEGEEYSDSSHVPLWGTKKSLEYQYNKSMGGYMIIRGEGYSSADYIFQVKIILPPNPNKKNRIIKVGRIDGVDTNPNDNAQGVAHSQFRSVTELLPYVFNHPHSALVGVSFDSRSYSSIPERKYLLKLQKVSAEDMIQYKHVLNPLPTPMWI